MIFSIWVFYFSKGYGLTEAGGVYMGNEVKGRRAYMVSVGVLTPNLEAKVVDTVTGTALFPGQSGELQLGGVSIMQGKVVLSWFKIMFSSDQPRPIH